MRSLDDNEVIALTGVMCAISMLVFIFISARNMNLPIAKSEVQKSTPRYGSIVRIKDEVSPAEIYLCSGVVVGPHTVLTALHCVTGGGKHKPSTKVEIRPSSGRSINRFGTPLPPRPDLDQVFIRGDFSDFEATPADNKPVTDVKNLVQPMSVCGFPHGANMVCLPAQYRQVMDMSDSTLGQQFFEIELIGVNSVIPGMSGGPVFSYDGKLLGVVTANNYGDPNRKLKLSYFSPIYDVMVDAGEK